MEADDYYSTEESGNWSSRLNSTEICRVCATSNGYLIPIYEGEGLDNELAMKIQKHLPIQISEEDTFPKQVCYQCASTLIAWHELVITCVEADRKIRNLENEEDDEDYQVDDKIIEETPAETCIVQIKTAKSLQPSISDKPVSEEQSESEKGKKRRDALKDCTTVKIVEVKTPTPGPSAQEASSKSPSVQEIMVDKERTSEDVTTSERYEEADCTSIPPVSEEVPSIRHKDKTVSHINIKSKDTSALYCGYCQARFNRKCELATHLSKTHSYYVFHCELCDRVYKSKNMFIGHIKRHNTREGNTKTIRSKNVHDKVVTGGSSFIAHGTNTKKTPSDSLVNQIMPCDMCSESFSDVLILNAHKKADHSDIRFELRESISNIAQENDPNVKHDIILNKKKSKSTYKCDLCSKSFTLKDSYISHKRTHTGEKPFTCHICGKQFSHTGGLYYHLKHVHAGIKDHSCDICGRRFALKAAMEDHRRIHTGERPYVCHTCGKSFKTKASLYIHSKIHTDSFPHPCSYCERRFRWKQQLLAHVTTHTGEKRHICDVCGKGFGVKNDLTRHKKIHSSEKPYTCAQCGTSFGQKRYLRNHEKSRHDIRI